MNPTKASPPAVTLGHVRTELALDRTTLAWIRTTLGMTSFGLGTVSFFRSLRAASPSPESIRLHAHAIQFGTALVILGTVSTLLAGLSHWQSLKKLRADEPISISRWPLSVILATLTGLLGLVGLWNLFSH